MQSYANYFLRIFFMKHLAWLFLLLSSFSWCGSGDNPVITDKSQRVGRFSHEDSFDEKLVQKILNNSSSLVKKNVKKLLYPDDEDDVMSQRLLLLGGTSNSTTTVTAKAIAVRCGYEYYVIEAAPLLRDYREGRLMILNEVRSIIKQGKPVAIIITELAEMADYSGILASTLWLIVDQCAQYPDVLVIGTSAFQEEQLSEDIKKRFGDGIVSIEPVPRKQKNIKNTVESKTSWIKRHKVPCILIAGLVCISVAAGYGFAQIELVVGQIQEQEENNKQNQLLKNQQLNMQEELTKIKKQVNRLVEMHRHVD